MKASSPSSRAFSLMELMVVIGIMAILAVVALPALKGTNSAAQLTGASQKLSGELNLARQTATTRNQPVEVRFYLLPDPTDSSSKIYRGFQSLLVNDDGTYAPVTQVSYLPTGLTANTSSTFSTLITESSADMTSTLSLPTVGKNYTYRYFQIRPDGSLTFSNTTTTNSAWYVTLEPLKGPSSTSVSGLKQNYATIQIDPIIGTVRVSRP